MDEPFTGLDPINTNLIKEEIRQLNEAGTSIIFSTHRMEQVEEMCDHIVLINRGQNVLQGEVQAIKNQYKEHLFRVETQEPALASLGNRFPIMRREKNAVTVQLNEGADGNDLLREVLDQGLHIVRFEEILPTFNEIFIRRVGETEG